MKRNIIFYLISLICGILFCYFLKIEHFTKFYIFLGLAVACLFSYVFRFNKIRLLIFMLSLGFLVSFFSEKESNLKSFFDQEISFTGEVLNSTARSDGDGFRHEVRLKNIENTEKTEKILLFTNHKQFEIGDIVSVTGKLREIKSNGNPRLFNYKRFNLKKKIFSNIYSDDVKKIGENKNLKRDFHKFVENVFDTFLSTDNSNIMKRIFLANNYDADFENNIREIGLSHILAVSGLHIGIIYLILSKILVILPIKRLFREIIILFFIF